ncbi:sodium:solute symporter family protein [Archaeoglobus veneficus]|uniref:Na+/solute symporter n=1 Tax=Archaeoglobus veneficus (strain DSM 11195 / SNP6) TaxID=693661 RepID=F2KQA3_ARCVS|nr:sodium:solute symporter family protein [Archaeoglobus veneficus]AEA46536.1 Na+/solute symporter [Archaeoglobus veneficus SNP6]
MIKWAIVTIYFAAMLLLGCVASRKIKNVSDYIVGGRNLGFWMFVMLVMASTTSGMTLLGVSGLGFAAGWPTIWEQIFVPLACAFSISIFGYRIWLAARENGYLTVQDFLAHRYGSNAVRTISSIVVLVTCIIYLTGQYTAIAIVLTWLFDIPRNYALVVAAAIVVVYVILGGLYAVAWTTFVQGMAIIAGILLTAPFIISAAGGIEHINSVLASIDPNMVEPFYPQMHPPYAGYAFATPFFILSFFFLLSFGLASAPHVINNVLTAKNEKDFKWSPLVVFVIYAVIMYLIKLTGFAARAMHEEGIIKVPSPDYAYIAALEAVMPEAIFPVFAVVVLAAVMSTTDRLMLTIGSTVGWDIYKNVLKKTASDAEVTFVSRIAIVVTAVGTVLLALNPPKLLAFIIWMGIGIMLSTFVAPILLGLYWRRATKEGAIASMVLGFAASLLFGYWHKFVSPLPAHFSLFSFAISVFAMVAVSLLTGPVEAPLKEKDSQAA